MTLQTQFTKLFLAGTVLLSSYSIQAQDGVVDLLSAGKDNVDAGLRDANKLMEGYIAPFIKGFGYGMSNGWNNTAKPHKKFGVELTFTANLAYVPTEDFFLYGLRLRSGITS